MTSAAGLPAYEISSHAAPGEASRHNLIYWRQGDYVGVGPGAHGRVTIGDVRQATAAERQPAAYLSLVERTGCGAVVENLSAGDILTERLAMGLRTLEGVAMDEADWAQVATPFAGLSADGLLERRGERLYSTADGRRILNTVLAKLL